ncbi:ABC transporter substrate-binding protein [Nonomuraea sp. NPDC048916]|uniref:ABC transporter substrate-binding protein n=1 Tax=Nonomuraea sp. NPDC048916 TaxID=3154232 RepID=UPI0033F2B63C
MFAPFITFGPSYIQQWLTQEDYNKAYSGPYDGKRLDGIETPDDKTIVFTVTTPHADANYAFAMGGYAIVPKVRDIKEEYDKEPTSSGPYMPPGPLRLHGTAGTRGVRGRPARAVTAPRPRRRLLPATRPEGRTPPATRPPG